MQGHKCKRKKETVPEPRLHPLSDHVPDEVESAHGVAMGHHPPNQGDERVFLDNHAPLWKGSNKGGAVSIFIAIFIE